MDKNTIADVLEDAARLYEDEKVDWCSGAWVQEDPDSSAISACAEGALLKAAGYTWDEIETYSDGTERSFFLRTNRLGPNTRYILARAHLIQHLRTKDPAIGGVPAWNDALEYESDIDNEQQAKQAVVSAFKNAAKELRNG